jgi:hypothetical protein
MSGLFGNGDRFKTQPTGNDKTRLSLRKIPQSPLLSARYGKYER